MRRTPPLLASLLLAGLLATAPAESAMAYEAMYPRTDAGSVELKTVPAVKALQADGDGTYFKNDDSTFMKLFRYIDRNQVAMTVPVEAEVSTPAASEPVEPPVTPEPVPAAVEASPAREVPVAVVAPATDGGVQTVEPKPAGPALK